MNRSDLEKYAKLNDETKNILESFAGEEIMRKFASHYKYTRATNV